MKWSTTLTNRYKWHDWFAWYPVIVTVDFDGTTYTRRKAWLETIQRKFKSFTYDDEVYYRNKECKNV